MAILVTTGSGRPSRPRVICAYIVVSLVALSTVIPFLLMVSTSLTKSFSAMSYPPKFVPTHPQLDNYVYIVRDFQDGLFARWIFNSVWLTFVIVIGSLAVNTLAAYAFAKRRFVGNRLLFGIVLSTLFIPPAVKLIPSFRVALELHLYNNFAAVIIPALASPIGIFMMRQFIASIPSDLLEAARLDGASELRVFAYIVVPLCRPALAVLGIFTAVSVWNDFLWPLVVLRDKNLQTLPLGLSSLASEFNVNYGTVMAGSVLAALPLVVMFVLLQRHFVEGIRLGGK